MTPKGFKRLTERTAAEIIEASKPCPHCGRTEKQTALAVRFNTTQATISRLLLGEHRFSNADLNDLPEDEHPYAEIERQRVA